MKKITIIGVGLMGGALARALSAAYPGVYVCGFARSDKSQHRLKKLGIQRKSEK